MKTLLRAAVLLTGLMLAMRLMFSASFSDYAELKVLDHINGKATFTLVTPVFMALCTTVPTDASTGTTLVEPTVGEWSNYARKSVAAADFNAAAGATATATNLNPIVFVGFAGGTGATIVGFAIVDALTLGNVHYWGTVTSKLINASNTPATVAAAGLSVQLD